MTEQFNPQIITFRITKEMKEKIDLICQEEFMNFSEFVRRSLVTTLKREKIK